MEQQPSGFSFQSAVEFMLKATGRPTVVHASAAPAVSVAAASHGSEKVAATGAAALVRAGSRSSAATQTDVGAATARQQQQHGSFGDATAADLLAERQQTLDSAFVPAGEEEAEESSFSQWCRYTSEAILAGAPRLGRPFFGTEQEHLQPEELLECEDMLLDEQRQQQQQYAVSSAIPEDGERPRPLLQLPVHREVAGLPLHALKPLISYRVAGPADWEQLQQLHSETFPFVYDDAFYSYICSGRGFALVATLNLFDIREKQQQQQQQQKDRTFIKRDNSSNPASAAAVACAAAPESEEESSNRVQEEPGLFQSCGLTAAPQQQQQRLQQEELLIGVISVSQNMAYIRPEDAEAVRQWLEQREQGLLQCAAADAYAAATATEATADAAGEAANAKRAAGRDEGTPHAAPRECIAAERAAAAECTAAEYAAAAECAAAYGEEGGDVCRMHPTAQQQNLFSLPSLLSALSSEMSGKKQGETAAADESRYSASRNGGQPLLNAGGAPQRALEGRENASEAQAAADKGHDEKRALRVVPSPEALLPAALSVDAEVNDLAYVLTLAVAAPFRRLGVAADLLQHTVNFLRSVQNPAPTAGLYLHAADYNAAALAFYAKHGFSTVSFIPSFYCINHRPYGSYLCCLHLHEGCRCCCRRRQQQAQHQQQARLFLEKQTGTLVRGLEGVGKALRAVGKSVSAFLNSPDGINDNKDSHI